MLVVRGVNVFPTEIEAVLLADERVSPHYLVVEDRREAARPELIGWRSSRYRRKATWPPTSTRALRERLGITCVVRVLAGAACPRVEVGKAKRLVRWSDGPPPLDGLAG